MIKENERPNVGIWLMPTNEITGMLEHFISFLVPPGDILWPLADNSMQQVIATECRFPQPQTMKDRIHTWLAWQSEPGKPIGQAISKGYLDAHAPQAQQLISWVRRLFELEAT